MSEEQVREVWESLGVGKADGGGGTELGTWVMRVT